MRTHNATVSASLVEIIDRLVKDEGMAQKRVLQAVGELSRLFTKERAMLRQPYLDDPANAVAYLHYFLPVNLSKVQVLLDEMPAVESGAGFHVLDLGSGPGTGSLAVLDWWHRHNLAGRVSVVAVDSSQAALRQAKQLWSRYCQSARLTGTSFEIHEADLERPAWLEYVKEQAPFDLIVLANCLNEIHINANDPIDSRARVVTELLALLARQGTVMIVEPALRETSRALHLLRDRLVQAKACTIYSPCLHERDCPALVNPDDWCHEERAWVPPDSIQEVDKEVGFIKDALKFSYLLLRKDGMTIAERRPDVYRVVSELRELKGEKRAWLCNELGRQEVGRQDRLASPKNDVLDQWHRGTIVQIERIVHKEKGGKVSALGRIERDAAVRMIKPV